MNALKYLDFFWGGGRSGGEGSHRAHFRFLHDKKYHKQLTLVECLLCDRLLVLAQLILTVALRKGAPLLLKIKNLKSERF